MNEMTIPRVLYTFWHSLPLPPLIDVCIRSWALHNPGYTIVVLTDAHWATYITRPAPPGFRGFRVQHRSDWVRTATIAERGGVWVDASVLMTQGVATWCHALAGPTEFVGIGTPQGRIENWFFAAPPHGIAALWLLEYERAIAMGPHQYVALVGPQNNWGHVNVFMRVYLYHQLCLLEVLRTAGGNQQQHIQLYPAALAFPRPVIHYWYLCFLNAALNLGTAHSKYWALGAALPMYKITGGGVRCAAKIALLQQSIQPGSPLHLAGVHPIQRAPLKWLIVVLLLLLLVAFLSTSPIPPNPNICLTHIGDFQGKVERVPALQPLDSFMLWTPVASHFSYWQLPQPPSPPSAFALNL